jgi:hypothetical protein
MPKPIAVCIEDFSADLEKPGFTSCVAVSGREPGLRVDGRGTVLWKSDEGVACELWVSADERLILFRPEGAPPVTVRRAGRSLDVPFGKPVLVIDQDEVDVGGRNLRLHVHGQTDTVAKPAEIVPKRSRVGRVGRAAAAAVLGSVFALGGCAGDDAAKPPVEIRDQPPEVDAPPETPPIDVRDNPPRKAIIEEPPQDKDNEDKTGQGQQTDTPPINVRETPPDPEPEPPPPPPLPPEDEKEGGKTGEKQETDKPPIRVIDHPPSPMEPPSKGPSTGK